MHNCQCSLFNRAAEEQNPEDIVQSVPAMENGMSLGSDGCPGPQDPDMLKRACRPIKKPVIDVDDLEDVGDESLPSLAVDIVSSFFVLQYAANALVMELAATFIQFQDTLTGSLDRLMEFLVKEQAEVWENCHVALGLLQ
jgi:hypothetical protein